MKKLLSMITAMVMIFCLMPPVRSFADDGILYYEYDADGNKNRRLANTDNIIYSNTTVWDQPLYVVNGSVEIFGRIEVSGNVMLILTDDCSLTAKQCIHLQEGNSLTI